MLKKSLMLAVFAGAAVAPALAGPEVEVGVRDMGLVRARGYTGRVNVPAYDNWTNAGGATFRGTFARSRVADDFTVDAATPVPFTGTRYGFAIGAGAGHPATPMQANFKIYDTFVPSASNANVYQGTLVWEETLSFTTAANTAAGGVFYRIDTDFNGPFFGIDTDISQLFSDPDRQYVLVQEWRDGSGVRFPEPLAATAPTMVLVNAKITGTSNPQYYRDVDADGFIEGSEASSVATADVGLLFKLERDINNPPPSTLETISLTDGVTTRTRTGTGVQWFQVDLGGAGALDSLLTFLDFDTNGSATDMDAAIYNSSGQVVSIDRTSGDAGQAQFSYGVGRRAPVGTSRDYDGRFYDRTALGTLEGLNPGTYYLAVGPAGTSFNPSFTVSAPATAVSYNLRFETNAVSGAAPAPSVAPTCNNLGTISGLTALPALTLFAYEEGTGWWCFTTCKDAIDDGAPTAANYVDIDPVGSDTRFWEWFMFDSAGNLVSADNASGPDGMPQLSFGDTDPVRPGLPGVNTPGLDFAGQDGDLPAGTYYLAVAYDGFSAVPDIVGNGRWHLRNVGGSGGFSAAGAITPSWTSCDAGVPGLCEYDINGDGSADQGDVDCVIAAVAGDPSCVRTDVTVELDKNQDGNVDQGDVDVVVDVIAGGAAPGCP